MINVPLTALIETRELRFEVVRTESRVIYVGCDSRLNHNVGLDVNDNAERVKLTTCDSYQGYYFTSYRQVDASVTTFWSVIWAPYKIFVSQSTEVHAPPFSIVILVYYRLLDMVAVWWSV